MRGPSPIEVRLKGDGANPGLLNIKRRMAREFCWDDHRSTHVHSRLSFRTNRQALLYFPI